MKFDDNFEEILRQSSDSRHCLNSKQDDAADELKLGPKNKFLKLLVSGAMFKISYNYRTISL